MNRLRLLFATLLYIYTGSLLGVYAQRPCLAKLSPMLRRACLAPQQSRAAGSFVGAPRLAANPMVCAFIRVTSDADELFLRHHCRQLARYGSLYVALIPLDQVPAMSLDHRVVRIEAEQGRRILCDSTARVLRVAPVHQGQQLPQAFDGEGVVMGVMDIGFDLTHPTFYTRDTTDYRIRAFWDQLAADTVGSPLPVGRDYTTREQLLGLGHARDGLLQTHGTHTLGIAGGSGYDSPYQGMAPASDLVIVANAVTEDTVFIDPADRYKYTFATDALGFKYIFDQASAMGRPCVISFSEGSRQDFYGYDKLFYEMLDSLTGPGRIIVAAAGNEGLNPSWLHKPKGKPSAGTFLRAGTDEMLFTLKSATDFGLRFVAYRSQPDTLSLRASDILQAPDSTLTIVRHYDDDHALWLSITAYPPSLFTSAESSPSREICYDVTIGALGTVGHDPRLSFELLDSDADVEAWLITGAFMTYPQNPLLCDAEPTHNIHSPGSAPSVICVGGTVHRQGFTNLHGQWVDSDWGRVGQRGTYSSVGPTTDGRIKPDVMAPGINVISAYSSFYREQYPDSASTVYDVAHFSFGNRTYVWNACSGTSMSTPAVGGIIALWLQARPDLTPTDVMGVISRTSRRPDPALSYPNNYYGYGEIDAYAGLIDVLGLSSVEGLSARQAPVQAQVSDGRLILSFPQPLEQLLTLRLYALDGRLLFSSRQPAGSATYTFVLPRLSSGVYALQLTAQPGFSGSQLLRLK